MPLTGGIHVGGVEDDSVHPDEVGSFFVDRESCIREDTESGDIHRDSRNLTKQRSARSTANENNHVKLKMYCFYLLTSC